MTCLFFFFLNLYSCQKIFLPMQTQHTIHDVWDRHLEQSEVCEQTLNQRAFQKPEGIEESVLDMLEMEQLHRAIVNLPEVQRHRVVQYYFEGLTYQQIAREEHCSFQAVAKSISAAEKRMKKFLVFDLHDFKNLYIVSSC